MTKIRSHIAIPASVQEAAEDYCLEIARELVELIRQKAPVDTGNLQAGYVAVRQPEGAIVVNETADYWEAVEYGHEVYNQAGGPYSYVQPQPHVIPAIEEMKTRYDQ